MQVARGSKRVKIWHEVWEPLKWERIEEKRAPIPHGLRNLGIVGLDVSERVWYLSKWVWGGKWE